MAIETEKKSVFYVDDAPFCAAGDGVSNDRAAIQRAIDDAYLCGGGTVVLSPGKTYLSSGLFLKSNVELLFGDGATLLQSPEREGYYKLQNGEYVPYLPNYGHNFSEKIKWSHYWYLNYPLIFAPEGSHNFAVRGKGIIRMMEVTDPEKVIKICPIGFYRCSDFVISDVHITNYHGYAMMPFTSERGVISGVKITDWSYGNGDGVCLMNCRDIRVTGCEMFTGDDSVYIFSSYRDPRKSEWWSSDEPQASENIEIDHNDLKSNHCKAFGMILWGIDCPDQEKVEVRNVYVHDNHFETMGNWLYNPYSNKAGDPPVTGLRFENNIIDGIEMNFFETKVSDMTYYRSMSQLHNGGFEDGRVFWMMKKNSDPDSAGVFRRTEDEAPYGFIRSFENGEAALWQGLYIKGGAKCCLHCEVRTSGEKCHLFVRKQNDGELVDSLVLDNGDWREETFNFTVPEDGNYRIGIESGEAKSGSANIRAVAFGYHENASGYDQMIFDNGKMIMKYNDDLFKRGE